MTCSPLELLNTLQKELPNGMQNVQQETKYLERLQPSKILCRFYGQPTLLLPSLFSFQLHQATFINALVAERVESKSTLFATPLVLEHLQLPSCYICRCLLNCFYCRWISRCIELNISCLVQLGWRRICSSLDHTSAT